MIEVWGITLALFGVLFYLWILKRKRMFSVLKEMGIPGPEPNIFFGNLREIAYQKSLTCIKEWQQQYGNIFGYYFGAKPVIVVADVELVKKIQISDFHKFINRPNLFIIGDREPNKDEGANQLVNLKDKRWKDIRSTITPAFTASKMRLMAPIINSSIDTLMSKIDDVVQTGQHFDIYQMYQGLTMEIIGRTAFGVQMDCQKNPDDPFIKITKEIFSSEMNQKFVIIACDIQPYMMLFFIKVSFPEIHLLLERIGMLLLRLYNRGSNPLVEYIKKVKSIIKARKENPSNRRPDLLQQLIDAEVKPGSSDKDLTARSDDSTENKITENESSKKRLTEDEVFDNTFLFLLAGFETTSTALAYVTHFLIYYPEVQEKVRTEVLKLETAQGSLDYSAVHQLQYLDQVINESLRILSPVYFFVNREVGEDVVLNNYHIKKGISIQIPTYEMHLNEEYWPDPNTFDPDRFSPENKDRVKTGSYQTFGNGPRNCVGMRLALMQMKFTLARILRKYRLVKCEETDSHPPKLKISIALVTPANGIKLKAEPLETEADG